MLLEIIVGMLIGLLFGSGLMGMIACAVTALIVSFWKGRAPAKIVVGST